MEDVKATLLALLIPYDQKKVRIYDTLIYKSFLTELIIRRIREEYN